jgi:hypothetical protein
MRDAETSTAAAARTAPRDDKLVRVCALILEKWVGNLVASWRSSS